MKTTIQISSLLVCSVLLSFGCARTALPTVKTAAKPAEAPAPTAPAAPANSAKPATLAGGTNTSAKPAVAQPAGANDLAAKQPGARTSEPAAATAAPVTAPAAAGGTTITADDVLAFVDRLNLPLVVADPIPKHDPKEEKRILIGHACSVMVAKAKTIKRPDNLVGELPATLCNTIPRHLVNPAVTVVVGKYISRSGKEGSTTPYFDTFEATFRPDGSVEATKETGGADGVFEKANFKRLTVVSASGVITRSNTINDVSEISLTTPDKSVTYLASTTPGSVNAPVTTEKTLTLKNFRGLNVTVVEKSSTQTQTALGVSVPPAIECTILAVDRSAKTVISAQANERCIQRKK